MSRHFAFPIFLAACALVQAQVITTVAGGGFNTGNGVLATTANVTATQGIAVDGSGNTYFWDSSNVVRKVDTNGIINTVVGNGTQVFYFAGNIGDGGPAINAAFGPPGNFAGIAVDASGNLFISDPSNKRIRKVDANGTITTFGNIGFSQPSGLAVDSAGNLYAADINLGRVYKIDKSGTATTVAGGGAGGDGGLATSASIRSPYGIAVDKQGNLFISDNDSRVRKVDTSGIITTVAGGASVGFAGDGGQATKALFFGVQGLAVDNSGNLYIADNGNYRVRKVDASGIVTTVAGNGQFGTSGDGGLATNAPVKPDGLAVDSSGNLYATATTVRRVAFGTAPAGLYASAAALYFEGTVAHPGAFAQVLTVATLGAPINFQVSATSQSGGNGWLSTSAPNGPTPQALSINVGNGPTAAGTYKGTVMLTPITPGYSPILVQVTYVINATPPAAAPVITEVDNGASFQAGYLANSIWTIKGTNLASTTDTWNNSIVGGQLPTSLDGVTVSFGGYPAYLSYISSTQINLLTPNSGVGTPTVTVNNNGATSAVFPIQGQSAPYSPAFFLWPNNQIVATHTDYTYAVAPGTFSGLTTIAAKPGEVIVLWGTGFGPTNPATQTGAVTPSDKVYSTSTLPTVTINGVPATVYGAALAPGAAGEYQVAIQVPSTLPNGTYAIVASMGAVNPVSSPSTVLITVHN